MDAAQATPPEMVSTPVDRRVDGEEPPHGANPLPLWLRGVRLTSIPIVRAGLAFPVLAAAFPVALAIRYDAFAGRLTLQSLLVLTLFGGLVKTASFHAFGVFRIRTRHLSLEDLLVLLEATLFASVAFVLIAATAPHTLLPSTSIARSVWLIDWGVTWVACCGIQVLRRLISERVRSKRGEHGRRRALIVGTELVGEVMLHAVRRAAHSPFQLVGFISVPDNSLASVPTGTTIGGMQVVGVLDQACRTAVRLGAPELIVTAGDLSGRQLRSLTEEAAAAGLNVTVLPSYPQLLSGQVSMQPRAVEIEDLLQRDPVQLDDSRLAEWLGGRRVLVTGSSGSIGSEVCRQLLRFEPEEIILVDQNETGQFFLERELQQIRGDRSTRLLPTIADVRDAERMEAVFDQRRPEIVFHAAAYKHVPLMESNGGEAVRVNVIGTKRLADLADRFGCESFVMVSTDKAVRPTSRMGATKRVAELYVQALAARSSCRFVTVRFGNVLGSNGSVVPIFRQQIARGGPVTVTHPEMTRFFMTIPEAAQLIIQAGGQGRGSEIFVLDMGEPVRVLDLARDMIRLSGLQEGEDIEIAFTGSRPGEKLYEELYTDGESRQPTEHRKILVAESEEINFFRVNHVIAELDRCAYRDIDRVDELIASLVPSYRQLAAETNTTLRIAATVDDAVASDESSRQDLPESPSTIPVPAVASPQRKAA